MKRKTWLQKLICVAALTAGANGIVWFEYLVLAPLHASEHFRREEANIERLKADGYEFVPILSVPQTPLDDYFVC
jgi:hypothetical protein